LAHCCEYYPCHKNLCTGFNCDFCYCPLYNEACEEFGGKPEWLITKCEKIKDCTNCILPHMPEFKEIKDERIQSVLRGEIGYFW